MMSWVFLFSRFTPEALLIETTLLFFLCCCYAAFWVLRKRRYGSVDTTLPVGPVKTYLADLINQTEDLKIQLFGLIDFENNSRHKKAPSAPAQVTKSGPNPELEGKLLEKTTMIESLTLENAQLKRNLTEAKEKEATLVAAAGEGGGGAPASAAAAGTSAEEIAPLQERIKDLEAKLGEYNILEDDLANLKRLKFENEKIKAELAAALANKGDGLEDVAYTQMDVNPAEVFKASDKDTILGGAAQNQDEILSDLINFTEETITKESPKA